MGTIFLQKNTELPGALLSTLLMLNIERKIL